MYFIEILRVLNSAEYAALFLMLETDLGVDEVTLKPCTVNMKARRHNAAAKILRLLMVIVEIIPL